jgi:MFS family permease
MTSAPKFARRELLQARIAVSVAFFLLGFGAGLWAVHIPVVQQRLGIDPAVLGLVLLALAVGAMAAMPMAGLAVAKFGSRRTTALATLAFTLAMPLPMVADSVALLFVAAGLFGFWLGGLDVSMNVQASQVEHARRQPTMSSFHGFYSVGGLVGAILGAAVIGLGFGRGAGAVALAALLLGFAVWAALHLLPAEPSGEGGPRFALPNRAVIGLGLLAFLCFAIEGAVADWSALFLATVKGAGEAAAASGYALFSLAMTICRLTGDRVVARLGARTILVGGGALMALGHALALASPWPLVGAVGFALVGLGAANVVPVVFSAAGRTPGVIPSVGVAAVATLGYTGFLIFPPILGFVGKALGLPAALTLVLLMSVVVAVMGMWTATAAR